jgi:hypothetical protein
VYFVPVRGGSFGPPPTVDKEVVGVFIADDAHRRILLCH